MGKRNLRRVVKRLKVQNQEAREIVENMSVVLTALGAPINLPSEILPSFVALLEHAELPVNEALAQAGITRTGQPILIPNAQAEAAAQRTQASLPVDADGNVLTREDMMRIYEEGNRRRLAYFGGDDQVSDDDDEDASIEQSYESDDDGDGEYPFDDDIDNAPNVMPQAQATTRPTAVPGQRVQPRPTRTLPLASPPDIPRAPASGAGDERVNPQTGMSLGRQRQILERITGREAKAPTPGAMNTLNKR